MYNDDGTTSVKFETAVYTGNLEQQLVEGKEYEIHPGKNGETLKGFARCIDGQLYVTFINILLKFNYSHLHVQSKVGQIPVQFDLVSIQHGIHEGKRALIKEKKENTYTVILLNSTQINVDSNDLILLSKFNVFSNQNSQYPNLGTPGMELPRDARNPMPLYEPPTRDENPIPERESYLLACAFPTLFQTGKADFNAPRLRSLGDKFEHGMVDYINHCLRYKDGRFVHHPRFLYVLWNRVVRYSLSKLKTYYLKHEKPTPEHFKPENRRKTIKKMTAYAAKLPITPGYKLERRNELENMCEQIQYMTANESRTERININQEYRDYESSDDEQFSDGEQQNTDFNIPVPPSLSASQEQRTNKKVHKRPIEGVIPCYWATLTTAPFRTSVIPFYITGHHETVEDVRVRRQLAIKNPHYVAFFSALRLELTFKYLMVYMLELDDYYCVFEWGSGGVLHLHCILWNFKSQYLDKWDLEEQKNKKRFSRRKIRRIAAFFNAHVSEWHLGKDVDGAWELIKEEDGTWKNILLDLDNVSHPASISKQEFEKLLGPLSSEDNLSLDEKIAQEETKSKRQSFVIDLLEKVQQHNIHKPNPFGPPSSNQKCSKQKPDNKKVNKLEDKNYCTKGFPKKLCRFQEEYIKAEPYRDHLFKLYLERNDQTLNNYNAAIILGLLANMDLQPILTYEGLIGYCTKYLTKYDRPDVFRDIRDDTGKPTDAAGNISRNEITVQQKITKWFNEHIKYNMISSPELYHHILKLPTHFKSRSFFTISLQSDLNKLLKPT